MKTRLLAVLAALFVLGSASQLWADNHDGYRHGRSGYWDNHNRYYNYESYNNHRGYWSHRNGVRFFINID